MKKKTSFSIEESTLEKAARIAAREDRSVSYLVEKTVEAVMRVAEEGESYAATLKRVADELEKQSKASKK